MEFRQVVPTLIEIAGGNHPRADPEIVSRYQGDFKRAFLLLVDALGKRQMEYFRRPKVGDYYDIRTVVPSLTPTAIISLVYGMKPDEHGIIGGVIRAKGVKTMLKTVEGSVLGTRLSVPLDLAGIDMKAFFIKQPPSFEGNLYVAVDFLMKYGLSSFFSELNVVTHGFLSIAKHYRELLSEGGVLKLYYRSYDATAHDMGPYSREAQLEARMAAMRLRNVALSIPQERRDDTLFVILGDHGQDEVQIDVANFPEYRQYMGSAGKVYYIYSSELLEKLEDNLPKEHYEFYSPEEFRELLGDSETDEQELMYRIGEGVVVAKDGHMMRLSENHPNLRGMHGGLTDEEMDVRVYFLDREGLMELTDAVLKIARSS